MGNAATRKYIKQDLDRAIGNLEWAQDKLRKTAETLNDTHQDLAMKAILTVEAIEYIKTVITSLNEEI